MAYDALPYAGDVRGGTGSQKSGFAPVLLAAPKVDVNGTDASADYDIYYRTDARPSTDAGDVAAEVESDKWTTSVDDYSKVTAIKVMSKPGVDVPAHATVNVVLNMRAPGADAALRGKKAWNNFYISYNNSGLWGASNNVSDSLPGFLKFEKRSSTAGCAAAGSSTGCDAATLLGGSEWSLETPAGKKLAVTDCTGAPCAADSLDQDPVAGRFDLNLPAGVDANYGYGTYKLVETKTPEGYQLLGGPVSFTVSADNPNVALIGLGSIVDSPRGRLPLTGGNRTAALIIAGAALAAFGAAGLAQAVSARRKREAVGPSRYARGAHMW